MKPPQEQTTGFAGKGRWGALVIRAVLFTLVALSLLLTSRSVNRLILAQGQTRSATTRMLRVNSEVEELEALWPQENVQQLLQRYAELPSVTYPGQEALGEWLRDLKTHADPLALDANVQFGSANAPITTNRAVTTIPATVTIQLRPQEPTAAPRSPYERLLRLVQHLVEQPRRADLVEIEVHGASNSVSRAVAKINLWSGEVTQ